MDERIGFPVLVADIGGTNARFALAEAGITARPVINSVQEYPVKQFESLALAAQHYLTSCGQRPRGFVVAVAAAIVGDLIKVTNNDWWFSIDALREQLGLDRIKVINDFGAVGLAVPHLLPDELEPIGQASPREKRPDADRHYAALGPGTGLGVCRVMVRKAHTTVTESEGGHVAFAPGEEFEISVLRALMRRFARVSVERLVSGPGLCNVYEAVCAVEGVTASPLAPADITARAAEGTDAQCLRAVELVCSVLGSFAGDVALIYGAWDGVYLGGGLTSILMPWLGRGDFRRRFVNKGRFSALMETIPTFAIAHVEAGLLGTGAWAIDAWS